MKLCLNSEEAGNIMRLKLSGGQLLYKACYWGDLEVHGSVQAHWLCMRQERRVDTFAHCERALLAMSNDPCRTCKHPSS